MRNVKIGTHNAVKRFKTEKLDAAKNNNFTVVCLFAIIIEH